jgi:ABC-type bacteriocin/lantibiotic exporter with double-glycine peptidase domain
MKLNVPFLPQRHDHTCGPAALQMVLKYFGNDLSESKLCTLAGTTRKTGTARLGMLVAFRRLGFFVHAHADSSLRELRGYLDEGIPVIVNYRDFTDNEGHYGVVVGYQGSDLIIHDPYLKRGFFLANAKAFEKRWHGYHEKQHRHWLLAASPKPFPKSSH